MDKLTTGYIPFGIRLTLDEIDTSIKHKDTKDHIIVNETGSRTGKKHYHMFNKIYTTDTSYKRMYNKYRQWIRRTYKVTGQKEYSMKQLDIDRLETEYYPYLYKDVTDYQSIPLTFHTEQQVKEYQKVYKSNSHTITQKNKNLMTTFLHSIQMENSYEDGNYHFTPYNLGKRLIEYCIQMDKPIPNRFNFKQIVDNAFLKQTTNWKNLEEKLKKEQENIDYYLNKLQDIN